MTLGRAEIRRQQKNLQKKQKVYTLTQSQIDNVFVPTSASCSPVEMDSDGSVSISASDCSSHYPFRFSSSAFNRYAIF